MSDHEDVPPIVHAMSGAVASIFSNSFVYPLDLITTRLQTQDKDKKRNRRASGTPLTHDKHYDGLAHALFTIYEEEGAASLWQGVMADNVSTMASTFCYHFAYNAIRDRRFDAAARKNGGQRPRVLGMVEELAIGASAGVIARFATSPASNVVTRSQTQGGSISGIIKAIYKEKGITGFWSGMKASVLLAANPSISYYLFEVQKALFVPRNRRNKPRAWEIFLMSATGKAIATLLLYPIILAKAKTQALRAKSNLWTIVKTILERDGLGGLYKGAIPQVMKGFLSQGILMLLKDRIATLIISGYLFLNRRSRNVSQSSYYYSDVPKTDVNGLIAATKDSVAVAVDNAVESATNVAHEVRTQTTEGVNAVIDKVSEMTHSARDSDAAGKVQEMVQAARGSDAVGKVQELVQSARESDATGKVQDMMQSARDGGQAGLEKAQEVIGNMEVSERVSSGMETVQRAFQRGGQDTMNAIRSMGSALGDGPRDGSSSVASAAAAVGDAPEWKGQGTSTPLNANTNAAASVDGAEWTGQTRS